MDNKGKEALKALRKGRNAERKDWSDKVNSVSAANTVEAKEEQAAVARLKPALALSDNEKEYFNAVASYLAHNHALEAVDSLILTLLARNIYSYTMAHQQLNCFDDYFQTHTNGAMSPSVAAQLAKQAEDQILKLSTKLGLSPADRAKIMSSFGAPEQDTPEDDILS